MKLAISTLGCPNWTWDEVVSTVKDLGIDGIEVRGVFNELRAYYAFAFTGAGRDATMARLAKLGLAIPVFSSSAVLSDKNTIQDQLDEAKEYFRLACDTKVPYVRVLGDRNPEPGENVDEGFVEEQVCQLSASAERFGVTMLLETNGVWSDTKKLAAMIDRVGSEHVGILWDVNHPVRYLDENVAVSYANVKRHLKHVHVKDSVKVDGKIRYRMPGHGDLPLAEAMALLEKDRFGGYVCLEWVKRWNDELEDPGIVFAEFVNFMRSLK